MTTRIDAARAAVLAVIQRYTQVHSSFAAKLHAALDEHHNAVVEATVAAQPPLTLAVPGTSVSTPSAVPPFEYKPEGDKRPASFVPADDAPPSPPWAPPAAPASHEDHGTAQVFDDAAPVPTEAPAPKGKKGK